MKMERWQKRKRFRELIKVKRLCDFIVRSLSNPLTETVDECWKDKTLWEKYQQYQRSMEGERDFAI